MDLLKMFLESANKPPKDINRNATVNQILQDRFLTPREKDRILTVFTHTSPVQNHLSTGDVVRGAIGAGLGSMGAKYVGTVVGGLFGKLNPSTMHTLQQTGAVAGALRGSKLWR